MARIRDYYRDTTDPKDCAYWGGLTWEEYWLMDTWLLKTDSQPFATTLEDHSPRNRDRHSMAILDRKKLDLWVGTHLSRREALASAEREPHTMPLPCIAEKLWGIHIDFRELPPILASPVFEDAPRFGSEMFTVSLFAPPLEFFRELKIRSSMQMHIQWDRSAEIGGDRWPDPECEALPKTVRMWDMPEDRLPEGLIEWATSRGCRNLFMEGYTHVLPDSIDASFCDGGIRVRVTIPHPAVIPPVWIDMAMSGEPRTQNRRRVEIISNLSERENRRSSPNVIVDLDVWHDRGASLDRRLQSIPAAQEGYMRIYTPSKARQAEPREYSERTKLAKPAHEYRYGLLQW